MFKVFLSGYTKQMSRGIYYCELEDGRLSTPKLVAQVNNPTYLQIDMVNSLLYCNNSSDEGSSVICFKIKDDNTLEKVSESFSKQSNPCYLSLDSDCDKIYTAVYKDGAFEARTYDAVTGHIFDVDFTYLGEGSGPNTDRQDKSHLHIVYPKDNYIFICDLGDDSVLVFEKKSYKLLHKIKVAHGGGPRHIIFNKNKAYIITELSNRVIELDYNKNDGNLKVVAEFDTLPSSFKGLSQGAAIRLGKDARYLYVSNRGHNSITVFELGEDGSILKVIQNISTYGDWCRDFNISPDHNYLIAGHEKSHNLTVYEILENGLLKPIDNKTICPECTCVNIY